MGKFLSVNNRFDYDYHLYCLFSHDFDSLSRSSIFSFHHHIKHYATYVMIEKYPAHINAGKGKTEIYQHRNKSLGVRGGVKHRSVIVSCKNSFLIFTSFHRHFLSFQSRSSVFVIFGGEKENSFLSSRRRKKLIRFPSPSSFERRGLFGNYVTL